jgi:hypothetical protein
MDFAAEVAPNGTAVDTSSHLCSVKHDIRLRARERQRASLKHPLRQLTQADDAVERAISRIESGLDRADFLATLLRGTPPEPPTLRAKVGSIYFTLLRFALSWHMSLIGEMVTEQTRASKQLLHLIEKHHVQKPADRGRDESDLAQ